MSLGIMMQEREGPKVGGNPFSFVIPTVAGALGIAAAVW